MPPSTTRRRVLETATALAATLAGCSQFTADTTTTTRTDATAETTSEPRAMVDVAREAYLAKAWPLPGAGYRFPSTDAPALSDLASPVRDAVETAIRDGRYTTSDPSNALLDGVDGLDLVHFDGAVYDVTHTFPTITVRLDTGVSDAEAPDDRTVSSTGDAVQSNDAVQDVVATVAAHGPQTEASPYETTRLRPAVRDFLDRYDYVRTPQGVGELVVSRTHRTPPHTIRADDATDRERYGSDVHEAARYGPPTRDLIRRVLDSDRRTPGNHQDRIHTLFPDDVPREFARELDRASNYVRVDDSVYGFDTRHVHWPDLPVDFRASVAGDAATTAGPVDVELAVDNPTDDVVQLSMPGVAPFGVLWAYGPGGERVLWNDAYADTGKVSVTSGRVVPERNDELDLPPGQSAAATYRLGHDELDATGALASGTYEVLGSVWARWPTYEGADRTDWRSELFPYTLTIAVA